MAYPKIIQKEQVKQFVHDSAILIRSTEINKSLGSLTLDHMIKEQIYALTGQGAREVIGVQQVVQAGRVPVIKQLQEIKDNIARAVDAVKAAGSDEDALINLGIVSSKE